jgi:hypothetical protein
LAKKHLAKSIGLTGVFGQQAFDRINSAESVWPTGIFGQQAYVLEAFGQINLADSHFWPTSIWPNQFV